MAQQRTVKSDNETIAYLLTRRRARRITIRITQSGEIRVTAPKHASSAEIDGVVHKHFDRIRAALARVTPPPPLADGATVFYLGEPYRLSVAMGTPSLTFENGVAALCVSARTRDVEGAYQRACREHFLALIRARCLAFSERNPALAERCREIRVRRMTGAWGNCRPECGVLTFSTALLRFPISLIDSVIAHEYTHLLHRGHGEDFYRALARIDPEYREHKRALEAQNKEQRKEMAT